MLRKPLPGTVAGAVDPVVPNGVTRGDMAYRGKGVSSVPAGVAGKTVEGAGLALPAKGEGPYGGPTARNRSRGSGALRGYAVGLLGLGAPPHDGLVGPNPKYIRRPS